MAALQLRPKHRALHNPSLVHLFSTSSTPPEPTSADQSAQSDPSESQSSLSSYFSDVKASLKQQQQQHRPASPFSQRNPTIPAKPSSPLDSSFPKPSEIASLEKLRKNLSEFLLRSSVPPLSRPNSSHGTTPSSESSSQHISSQELYKRNVTEKADENGTNTASGPGNFGGIGGKLWVEAFRESLRQMRSSPGMAQNEGRRADPMSLSACKNNLKLEPSSESSSQHISSQEHYKRNVTEKADENGTNTASGPGNFGGIGGKLWVEAFRESLRQMRSSPGMAQNEGRRADPMSLSACKNNLKLEPSSESSSQRISFEEHYKRNVTEKVDENGANTTSGPGNFGGSGGKLSIEAIRESLQQPLSSREMAQNEGSVFDKEREQKDTEGEKMAMKTEFVKDA